jgi:putative endonuclease
MLWRGLRKPKTWQELGRIAEDHAARHLRSQGHRVIARNYRAPTGEIDIITEHRGVVVFVEVKSRSTDDLAARDSVTPGKQRRIVRTAAAWLSAHGGRERVTRFDVVEVAITPEGRVERIDAIEGAFRA